MFDTESADLAEEWSQIGRFTALTVSESGEIFDASTKVCPSTLMQVRVS